GTVGKILPGREFKLSEDGEILVRGENVSSGYWEQGAVRPADQEGWLRTGDLGELDAEGNLRFRGRKKNVIVTPAGLNVYPEDLETALRKQTGVQDCVVVPFERGGNAEPCAVLLLKQAERTDATRDSERDNSPLDRVDLLSALEEKFHVELNETAFADTKTVADVERVLLQPAARRSEYIYPRWTQREPIRLLRLAVYYALAWPATQILGHPRIVGRENLRDLPGPVLIVSNHITRRADIGLILAALPLRYRHHL